jgi:hypothetical protein
MRPPELRPAHQHSRYPEQRSDPFCWRVALPLGRAAILNANGSLALEDLQMAYRWPENSYFKLTLKNAQRPTTQRAPNAKHLNRESQVIATKPSLSSWCAASMSVVGKLQSSSRPAASGRNV